LVPGGQRLWEGFLLAFSHRPSSPGGWGDVSLRVAGPGLANKGVVERETVWETIGLKTH
jgi:hypothetical protein